MRLRKPVWTLNEVCPVCGQGSALVFSTCSNCQEVILVCAEEGSVFPNPNNLEIGPCGVWDSTYTKCPHCKVENEFRDSTGEEIQGLGFSPTDYHGI